MSSSQSLPIDNVLEISPIPQTISPSKSTPTKSSTLVDPGAPGTPRSIEYGMVVSVTTGAVTWTVTLTGSGKSAVHSFLEVSKVDNPAVIAMVSAC